MDEREENKNDSVNSSNRPEGEALTFENVLEQEIEALQDRIVGKSKHENVYAKAHKSQLVGLAFSGGGIRSATFNLGVLQALAKHGRLDSFHYLSTVSGGGYIGSWFSAWAHRRGLDEVENRLKHEIEKTNKDEREPVDKKWSPITFLRHFSNYLTPKTGVFSVDTWTAVTTYCGNLLLNLSTLILAIAAILLVPRLIVSLVFSLHDSAGLFVKFDYLFYVGIVCIIFAIFFVAWNLSHRSTPPEYSSSTEHLSLRGKIRNQLSMPAGVVYTVVLPLFLAGIVIAISIPSISLGSGDRAYPSLVEFFDSLPLANWTTQPYVMWVLIVSAVYVFSWASAMLLVLWLNRSEAKSVADTQSTERSDSMSTDAFIDEGFQKNKFVAVLLVAAFSSAVGGVILRWLSELFSPGKADLDTWVHGVTWLPPSVLLTFILIGYIHMGLMGRTFTEPYRQWFRRVSAWLVILSLGWLILFNIVFYGPLLLNSLGKYVSGALSASWIATTIAGLWFGGSSESNGRSRTRLIKLIGLVAPYVFLVGLLMAISLQTNTILDFFAQKVEGEAQPKILAYLAGAEPSLVIAFFLVVVAVATLLSWRLDINEISMHNFYRHRLARAYLGASRIEERRPAYFTGFDPDDDLWLSDLANSKGPIQILNTSINITSGHELGYQERKASSFFFTPYHFGFDPGRFAVQLEERGFRNTADGQGLTLGTVLAVSGAAINPNMGQRTSPALAFLMTVFNLRLGLWLRNPRDSKWRLPGPRFGLALQFKELLGAAGVDAEYVNLADGGFFDNLGIYELVHRRCRFILACDAEADPHYQFNALGNAIRRCRSDFGIDIEIQLDPLRLQENGFSKWHCAIGKIKYDHADAGAPDGTLIYLKSSLTGDEPEDLLNYVTRHPGFPHESTADQWFGESQFESYRMLGYHEADELFSAALIRKEDNVEAAFVALRRAWYPPSSMTAGSFTRHTEKLVEIFERVRSESSLAFLDSELYLDIDNWKGARSTQNPDTSDVEKPHTRTEEQMRAGFYLCYSMIQLMENVYLDLDLEHEWEHPDNRGWLNMFQHWSWSPMFRQTWAVCAATYGARFRSFCKHRLGLDLGTIWVEELKEDPQIIVGNAESSPSLGFTMREKDVLRQILRKDLGLYRICFLKMAVLNRKAQEDARRLSRFDKRSEPTRDSIDLEFTFGFALLREVIDGYDLGFIRVRDHLRHLGLGRRAILRLIVDHDVRDIKLAGQMVNESRYKRQIEDLFRSTINERDHNQKRETKGDIDELWKS